MKNERPKSPTKTKNQLAEPGPQIAFEDLTTDTPEAADGQGSTRVDLGAEMLPRVWQRWHEKSQEWQGYDLLSYEPSVEDLWHRLCMADVPIPMHEAMQNLDAFTSCAKKLLYLLSHTPAEYRHLRGDPAAFVEAVEEWADIHVPRAKNMHLVILMLQIHNAAHVQQASSPQ